MSLARWFWFPSLSPTNPPRKNDRQSLLSSDAYHRERPDIIILAITSQRRPTMAFGEVTVEDWQGTGLLKPSVLKPLLATLEQRLVIQTLGQLQSRDRSRTTELLSTILGR